MLVPSIFNDNFHGNFFDDIFANPFGFGKAFERQAAMSTDIQEFSDKYELDLELPGFSKEDIQAELKNGYLSICASRTEDKEEKDSDGRYIRRERYSGSYQRNFFVGKEITKEDIKARFENGILKLSIPKKESHPALEENHTISIEG